MNPAYSPTPTGVPYANPKGHPAGYPVGYAAPAYPPSLFPGGSPAFCSGYAPGTQFKMSCSPSTGAVPPYSSTPNPYPAVYPGRTYPQQNLYTQALLPSQQQGPYYTQPLYAAPPHVIHHTTVVQPNGLPAGVYAPQAPPPRAMVAGTTMAMSAGTVLTAHSASPVGPHPPGMPTYRHPATPTYSYVPPQW